MTTITESTVERATLDWLSGLGWQTAHGPDIAPDTPDAERADYAEVVLQWRLRDALAALNRGLPVEALDDAFRQLTRPQAATVDARNRAFHRILVNGVEVEYRNAKGTVRGGQVRVIDFDNIANNDWLAVNQFTVTENRNTRRPDVVLFVNGLPLGLIELKNPADEDATTRTAWNQLQTYKAELPTLFAMNEALVVSDGIEARLGTLTAGWEWFKPWRTVTGETLADSNLTELQVMLEGVFKPTRFLALLRDFIVFEDDGGALTKKMAGYHQFHAVRVAVDETLRAAYLQGPAAEGGRYEAGRRPGGDHGDRRIGVVWHTQGAGKSLTMAFYAGAIVREPAMENPHHRRPDRPQRPGRPTLRHLRPLPGPVAPAPRAGQGPSRPTPEALGQRWRCGVHHHPEVLSRGEGRHPPHAVSSEQYRGYRRRGPPQPVRLHRRLRSPHARRPPQRLVRRLHRNAHRA